MLLDFFVIKENVSNTRENVINLYVTSIDHISLFLFFKKYFAHTNVKNIILYMKNHRDFSIFINNRESFNLR